MQKKKSATHRMMDLLAQRDHSRLELRTKLAVHHSPEEVQLAIQYAEEHRWLAPESEIAEKFASVLHRKHKGVNYINSKLRTKGLPPVKSEQELELTKALEVIKQKFAQLKPSEDFAERTQQKGKLGRFLVSRGFDLNTVKQVVRKVFYE